MSGPSNSSNNIINDCYNLMSLHAVIQWTLNEAGSISDFVGNRLKSKSLISPKHTVY